jgi:dienelactone hydrolase
VQLGFFVLSIDAFGSGERYTKPAKGTYHGALYGSTLWPVGQTLLGMQVYDNRRAVDYMLSRPEVDSRRLGITGASGGGNQTMYAGALDERFRAVVSVCSVGTYQAYLHAACCVCEVLPGALGFTEEGDVLGLVAPRALMVITASRDAFQFSQAEAEKSMAGARRVFDLYQRPQNVQHTVIASGHDYNQPMREAMYGWMTRWLKDEGTGKPIGEPTIRMEDPEILACYGTRERPKAFLFPPSFAWQEAERSLSRLNEKVPDHAEQWESQAVYMRSQLRDHVLGGLPQAPRPAAHLGKPVLTKLTRTVPVVIRPEPNLAVGALLLDNPGPQGPQPACILVDLDGKDRAIRSPLCAALLKRGWSVLAPDLRGTGETQPKRDALRGAPDHNSAEHALWTGRPLLSQWVHDVACFLDWLSLQPNLDRQRVAVIGLGQAGIVALTAAGLLENRVSTVAAVDAPASLATDRAYADGTRMGLLAPGILRVADVPHLAALSAPRRLVIAGGKSPAGKSLRQAALQAAFRFTRQVYQACKVDTKFTLKEEPTMEDLAASL